MDELDLSGVDAMRRPEVRRRVNVVRDFLNIVAPTEADKVASAKSLGLSVNQFMALVRAWLAYGSAAKLAGSGAHRGATRRPSRLSVPAEAKQQALKVIEEVGADSPFVDVHRLVRARCAELKLAPPSRSTLWNMVMDCRKGRRGDDRSLVVGTCFVRLPTVAGETIELPSLTMAVRAGDGAIVAAGLSRSGWTTFLISVATSGASLQVDKNLLASAELIPSEVVVPIAGTAARSSMARILGRGIDNLHLIYQPSRAVPPQRLLKTKDDRPLSLQDAREMVDAAIARHNHIRGAAAVLWVDGFTS